MPLKMTTKTANPECEHRPVDIESRRGIHRTDRPERSQVAKARSRATPHRSIRATIAASTPSRPSAIVSDGPAPSARNTSRSSSPERSWRETACATSTRRDQCGDRTERAQRDRLGPDCVFVLRDDGRGHMELILRARRVITLDEVRRSTSATSRDAVREMEPVQRRRNRRHRHGRDRLAQEGRSQTR